MRVTFSALHDNATAGLERSARRMLEFQRQVSTGRRIERPSDAPADVAAATLERSNLASTEQYLRAADSVESRLTVIDTALSSLVTTLTAAQVEVLAARGTSKTPAQRDAAALALRSLRDAALDDLNTQYRGTYVFTGAAGTTPPYAQDPGGAISAYAGSTDEVSVDVDRGRAVVVAYDGDAIARGSEADDLFTVFDAAIAAAQAGDETGLGESLAALERAFERVAATQSRVGAAMRAVEDGRARLTETSLASQTRIAALEEVDMAAAITGMTQADTAYRAALGAASALTRPSLMDYLR